jgi:site-specific recombinase XerC
MEDRAMSKTINMKTAVEEYIKHLEGTGKSKSTLYTIGHDLEMAVAYFGEDKEVGKILPVHVAGFFKSDVVLKTSTGRERTQVTLAQIRRVFRMFLAWAQEQGYIDRLPLPKAEQPKGGKGKKDLGEGKGKKRGKAQDAAHDAPTPPTGAPAAEAEATPTAE